MAAASDIATMKQRNPGSHAGTLKARVIATKGPATYTSGGDQRHSLIVGLADMTGATKAVIYDSAQFQRYQAGLSVVIRNFILKADGSVIVTRDSRTFSTSHIDAADEYTSEASRLVHPPEALFMSLEQAAASPAKTLVSVRGHIVQVSKYTFFFLYKL
ncbi:hypothetical protein DPMN_058074 [Dreissena polymorpha]|uniref:Uncharacterized protein n=1 Tax=Dreissena polymorpha TaxID=45954 RepID=A0A9D4C1C8_DREPO|nr:hypothetical protein DPMN_058074 [Dreissena polymorpha]